MHDLNSPADPWEASGERSNRIGDAATAPGSPRLPGLVARRPPERAAGNESKPRWCFFRKRHLTEEDTGTRLPVRRSLIASTLNHEQSQELLLNDLVYEKMSIGTGTSVEAETSS